MYPILTSILQNHNLLIPSSRFILPAQFCTAGSGLHLSHIPRFWHSVPQAATSFSPTPFVSIVPWTPTPVIYNYSAAWICLSIWDLQLSCSVSICYPRLFTFLCTSFLSVSVSVSASVYNLTTITVSLTSSSPPVSLPTPPDSLYFPYPTEIVKFIHFICDIIIMYSW